MLSSEKGGTTPRGIHRVDPEWLEPDFWEDRAKPWKSPKAGTTTHTDRNQRTSSSERHTLIHELQKVSTLRKRHTNRSEPKPKKTTASPLGKEEVYVSIQRGSLTDRLEAAINGLRVLMFAKERWDPRGQRRNLVKMIETLVARAAINMAVHVPGTGQKLDGEATPEWLTCGNGFSPLADLMDTELFCAQTSEAKNDGDQLEKQGGNENLATGPRQGNLKRVNAKDSQKDIADKPLTQKGNVHQNRGEWGQRLRSEGKVEARLNDDGLPELMPRDLSQVTCQTTTNAEHKSDEVDSWQSLNADALEYGMTASSVGASGKLEDILPLDLRKVNGLTQISDDPEANEDTLWQEVNEELAVLAPPQVMEIGGVPRTRREPMPKFSDQEEDALVSGTVTLLRRGQDGAMGGGARVGDKSEVRPRAIQQLRARLQLETAFFPQRRGVEGHDPQEPQLVTVQRGAETGDSSLRLCITNGITGGAEAERMVGDKDVNGVPKRGREEEEGSDSDGDGAGAGATQRRRAKVGNGRGAGARCGLGMDVGGEEGNGGGGEQAQPDAEADALGGRHDDVQGGARAPAADRAQRRVHPIWNVATFGEERLVPVVWNELPASTDRLPLKDRERDRGEVMLSETRQRAIAEGGGVSLVLVSRNTKRSITRAEVQRIVEHLQLTLVVPAVRLSERGLGVVVTRDTRFRSLSEVGSVCLPRAVAPWAEAVLGQDGDKLVQITCVWGRLYGWGGGCDTTAGYISIPHWIARFSHTSAYLEEALHRQVLGGFGEHKVQVVYRGRRVTRLENGAVVTAPVFWVKCDSERTQAVLQARTGDADLGLEELLGKGCQVQRIEVDDTIDKAVERSTRWAEEQRVAHWGKQVVCTLARGSTHADGRAELLRRGQEGVWDPSKLLNVQFKAVLKTKAVASDGTLLGIAGPVRTGEVQKLMTTWASEADAEQAAQRIRSARRDSQSAHITDAWVRPAIEELRAFHAKFGLIPDGVPPAAMTEWKRQEMPSKARPSGSGAWNGGRGAAHRAHNQLGGRGEHGGGGRGGGRGGAGVGVGARDGEHPTAWMEAKFLEQSQALAQLKAELQNTREALRTQQAATAALDKRVATQEQDTQQAIGRLSQEVVAVRTGHTQLMKEMEGMKVSLEERWELGLKLSMEHMTKEIARSIAPLLQVRSSESSEPAEADVHEGRERSYSLRMMEEDETADGPLNTFHKATDAPTGSPSSGGGP